MMTYPAASDLSVNYCASRDASVLRLRSRLRHCYRPLYQNPEMLKWEINASAWYKESLEILHLHLLLRQCLRIRRWHRYLLILCLRTNTAWT